MVKDSLRQHGLQIIWLHKWRWHQVFFVWNSAFWTHNPTKDFILWNVTMCWYLHCCSFHEPKTLEIKIKCTLMCCYAFNCCSLREVRNRVNFCNMSLYTSQHSLHKYLMMNFLLLVVSLFIHCWNAPAGYKAHLLVHAVTWRGSIFLIWCGINFSTGSAAFSTAVLWDIHPHHSGSAGGFGRVSPLLCQTECCRAGLWQECKLVAGLMRERDILVRRAMLYVRVNSRISIGTMCCQNK